MLPVQRRMLLSLCLYACFSLCVSAPAFLLALPSSLALFLLPPPPPAMNMHAAAYASHLQNVVHPALHAARSAIAHVDADIAD